MQEETDTLTEGGIAIGGAINPSIAVMAEKKFNISGDRFADAVRELGEREKTALRWLFGYLRSKNLGSSDCEEVLPKKDKGGYYSWASIYAALTGRRGDQGASLTPMVESIEEFRRTLEGTSRLGDGGFIITRLYREIEKRCERARKRQRIFFLFGDSQIGKTEALKHYAFTHNHGSTIYIEVPTGGAITTLLKEFAEKLGIPDCRTQDMRARVMKCFDEGVLLVLDEGHRLFHGKRGLESLDFIRELYNRRGCGIVMAMTNEGKKELLTGTHAKRLEQLWRRRIAPLQTPNIPSEADMADFSIAYGLDPAHDREVRVQVEVVNTTTGDIERKNYGEAPLALQKRVLESDGLGVWLTILQDAIEIKHEAKKPMSWGCVVRAYCAYRADAEVWA
jgi:DNA transposition AAA+ family ATPase